jgi:hypothetical protein
MLLKVVALFLVFMVVMASVQKFFRGGRLPGTGSKRTALDKLRCAKCRRIQISNSPGPCERPDCEYR